MLQLKELSIGYNQTPVCEGIRLTVQPGEIIAVVGPNGCGKTTLFRTIMRELSAISGTITLRGKPHTAYTRQEYAKEVAVVTTRQPYTEHSTCRELVSMGRYPYSGAFGQLTPKDEEVVERVMRETGVETLADRRFTDISDGQRQRVLLAKALAQQTKLLLLDEPTSFLDIRYRLEFLEALTEKVRRDSLTVIMSIHEVELAARAADRVLCMSNGTAKCVLPQKLTEKAALCDLFGLQRGLYEKWM